MKIIFFVIAFVALGELCRAQSMHRTAPERVKKSFSRNFPEAGDARWNYSGSQWNATFDDRSSQDRGEMVAHFDRNGRYIDSHIPYAETDVPQPVSERARRRYRNGHVRISMIDRPSRPDVYQVQGRINGRTRTSYYDEQGRERPYSDRH
jgi:hypothetical protein